MLHLEGLHLGVGQPVVLGEALAGVRGGGERQRQSGDREGTPLAVLEAMASALPVIASRHAGIADAIEHGVHGLLCAEFDVESMARNMIAIIDDPALAARMGAAGRARAMEHYRMSDSIDRLHAILGRCARR